MFVVTEGGSTVADDLLNRALDLLSDLPGTDDRALQAARLADDYPRKARLILGVAPRMLRVLLEEERAVVQMALDVSNQIAGPHALEYKVELTAAGARILAGPYGPLAGTYGAEDCERAGTVVYFGGKALARLRQLRPDQDYRIEDTGAGALMWYGGQAWPVEAGDGAAG